MRASRAFIDPDSYLYHYASSQNAREGLLYLVGVGDMRYLPGYTLERQSYDSFEIMAMLSGSFLVEYPEPQGGWDKGLNEYGGAAPFGKKAVARAGDLVLLDCYQPHRYSAREPSEVLWCHFDGAPARAYYNYVRRANGCVFAHPDSQRVQAHLRAIFDFLHVQGAVNELEVAAHLTGALTLMASPAGEERRDGSIGDEIEELLAYVNSHLDGDLSVEELSRRLHMSDSHFIRVFREAVGTTPRQYVIHARLDAAKYLLTTTDLGVREIARCVGYSSETMFSGAFKKRMGMTPSEYRSESYRVQTR